MSTFSLKGVEIECVKRLAEMYEAGETHWRGGHEWERIGLSVANFSQVLGVMESIGAVGKAVHSSGGRFHYFVILPGVLNAARQIVATEEKNREGKDLVESIKTTVRKHPVLAWGLIAFVVLTAVMTLASQTTTFLKNVGLIK